jgi:hypothetical protein
MMATNQTEPLGKGSVLALGLAKAKLDLQRLVRWPNRSANLAS